MEFLEGENGNWDWVSAPRPLPWCRHQNLVTELTGPSLLHGSFYKIIKPNQLSVHQSQGHKFPKFASSWRGEGHQGCGVGVGRGT